MANIGGVPTGVSKDANGLKDALSQLKSVDRDKTAPYDYHKDRQDLIDHEKHEQKILADAWIRHCDGNGQRSTYEKGLTALASDPVIQPYGIDLGKLISDPPKSKDDFATWAVEERWVKGTDLMRVPKNESWEEHLEKRTARLKQLRTEET